MEQGSLIQIGLPIALFIIMAGMGLTLTMRDFHNVALNPRGTVVGTVLQIVLMPVLAFALIWAMDLPPAVAVGLVIIAACPGGTASNLFTFLARGDVALSIVLTVSASLITIVTLPLFTNIAMDLYMQADQSVSLPVLKTVATLVVIILLPVSIGMWIRSRAPEFAKRSEGIVSIFGALVLAALVVAITISVRDQFWMLVKTAGVATLLLNLGGIALGFVGGWLAGLSHKESLAVAIELGIKNGTLGLLVTLTLLNSAEMSTPSAVYSLIMFALGFVLIAYGRMKKTPQLAPAQG